MRPGARWRSASRRGRPTVSRFERLYRGRATSVGEQKRQLAEALAGTEDVDEHAVAERRQHAGAEATTDDEMERVGRIVAVEDDLALGERPAAGDREEPTNVLRRQIGEERPLHCTQSLTRSQLLEGALRDPFQSRRRAAAIKT